MKIEHHPDASTLMSYAAGSLPEALSVVVAAHLDVCPACAAEVTAMERIGASLFERIDAVPMLETMTEPGERSPSHETMQFAGSRPDEGVLTRLLGRQLCDVHWKRLGFGIWHYPIQLSPGSPGDLRLIKVAPGQVMPEHSHGGSELTLILDGTYSDEFGSYRTGDVSDLGDDVDHRPISDPNEGCICLIASEQKARFKDVVSRIFQPLTGL
jgi:putative transcriptional regulator